MFQKHIILFSSEFIAYSRLYRRCMGDGFSSEGFALLNPRLFISLRSLVLRTMHLCYQSLDFPFYSSISHLLNCPTPWLLISLRSLVLRTMHLCYQSLDFPFCSSFSHLLNCSTLGQASAS